ncbi:MAG TPA: hypothetical protein RMF84_08675 [Polyangiaceae bacterium LLY-WYZ-14_1]|nr:hypothetical protein [Polyangiaceae bacterium LLY-WYZ-14_1]
MTIHLPEDVLRWDDELVWVYDEVPQKLAGRVALPWDQLSAIHAVDPWPSVALVTLGDDGAPGTTVVGPVVRVGTDHPYDLAEQVEAFLAEARRRLVPVLPGWDQVPPTSWERVDGLPAGPRAVPAGAFRTPASWCGEPILLRAPSAGAWPRDETTTTLAPVWLSAGGLAVAGIATASVSAMLTAGIAGFAAGLAGARSFVSWSTWLPRGGAPRVIENAEAVVTAAHVYARRSDGTTWRISRRALRLEILSRPTAQHRFVFGRCAELRVDIAHQDELVRFLRRDLASRSPRAPTEPPPPGSPERGSIVADALRRQ